MIRCSLVVGSGLAYRVPKGVTGMGYNPANFAYHIGGEPWVPGYSVFYAISFYDARTGAESERSGLIRIPTDPTGRATARRVWRKFAGQPERRIDN